jgi:1-acyl-sn-glycerol-3-phosphate acyltransferase
MHRGNIRKAYQDIRTAVKTLSENRSLLIFPEGTRSMVDAIGPFKPGFLKIASEAGVELVPVTIRGTNFAMKKGSFLVDPARPVTIAFGSPISVSSLPKDPTAAAAAVRTVIAAEFEEMRKSDPG